jgi:hypothetical protein
VHIVLSGAPLYALTLAMQPMHSWSHCLQHVRLACLKSHLELAIHPPTHTPGQPRGSSPLPPSGQPRQLGVRSAAMGAPLPLPDRPCAWQLAWVHHQVSPGGRGRLYSAASWFRLGSRGLSAGVAAAAWVARAARGRAAGVGSPPPPGGGSAGLRRRLASLGSQGAAPLCCLMASLGCRLAVPGRFGFGSACVNCDFLDCLPACLPASQCFSVSVGFSDLDGFLACRMLYVLCP